MALKKEFKIVIGFILLVFLQGVITVSAQTKQTEQSNSEVRPFSDMTPEIALPEQTVLALQPIPIVIKQSNKTNQPTMGYRKILFGFTPIGMYVRKIGGNGRVAIGNQSPLSTLAYFINTQVAPGTVAETKGLITIGMNTYFPEPGVYEIQAGLSNDDGTQRIESNKVNIEIKMPTGANLAAYNLIKNSPMYDVFFSGMRFFQAEEVLNTITIMHPNTPYGKHSAFLLGESYFHLKRYPQALSNLIRLENDRDFIFADKVRNYLAEIRRSMQTQQ